MCLSVKDLPVFEELASHYGVSSTKLQPAFKNGDVLWYAARDEQGIADTGDVYYKILLAALCGGELYAYSYGIGIWGSSIVNTSLDEICENERMKLKLDAAIRVLCPLEERLSITAMQELENEEDNTSHLLIAMDTVELPSMPSDAFENMRSYQEFIAAFKASFIDCRRRTIVVLDDPSMNYVASTSYDACEVLDNEFLHCGVRCELI